MAKKKSKSLDNVNKTDRTRIREIKDNVRSAGGKFKLDPSRGRKKKKG